MSEPRVSEEGLLSLEDVASALAEEESEGGELAVLRNGGKDLVNYLYMSMRTLSIHAADNRAVREPLARLVAALATLSQYIHVIHLISVEGQIYLNDLRIKMEAAAFDNVQFMMAVFDKHGIGGLTFHGALSEEEVKDLLLLLLRHLPPKGGDKDAALESIRGALSEAGLTNVTIDKPYYFRSAEAGATADLSEDAAEQEQAALAYSKGVLAVKDYFRAIEAAEAANPLRIRKIVHDMVDVADESPDDFLKLHTIQGVEDVYYNHCVNVSSLAVGIGRKLGLTRVQLAELGAAAMFHDLGYAALEREASEQERVLSPEDRMLEHPVAGFKSLLRQAEYGPGLMRRLLVTLEHHMHYQRPGGYPPLGKKQLSVYTRIFQVADTYDALVTAMGSEPPMLPVQALETIVEAAGTAFDPVVVRAFVHVVGRYPYGSLVEMNTGEVGVVTSGGRSGQEFDKPRVMVVRSADGRECEPREVDLASKRVLERAVVAVLDPFDEELTPHAVLFSELGQALEEKGGADASRAAAEVVASMSLDAWNRAVWEESDPMAAVTGSLETIDSAELEAESIETLAGDAGVPSAEGDATDSSGPSPVAIPAATAEQAEGIDDPFALEPSGLPTAQPTDTHAVTVADAEAVDDPFALSSPAPSSAEEAPEPAEPAPSSAEEAPEPAEPAPSSAEEAPAEPAAPAPPAWMLDEAAAEEEAHPGAQEAGKTEAAGEPEAEAPSELDGPPAVPAWMDDLGEDEDSDGDESLGSTSVPRGVLTPTDELPTVPDTLDELLPFEEDGVADPFGALPPTSSPSRVSTPLVDPAAPTLIDELEGQFLESDSLAPDGGASGDDLAPAEEAEPTAYTEEEIARRKKAWQAAIQRAFAEGGEDAVQALSELSWQDFEPED